MNDHQRMMLTMLKDIDNVCRENNIHYMLFSGTALGAVRHHGFIPWDDDLDVIMLRSEYERFLDAVERDLDHAEYFVQKEFSEHWPMQFSKIRKNNTACMEKFHPKDRSMHQGVYIDIFPCDNLANSRAARWAQFAASKIVIAKSLYARGYETDSLLKKGFMQFCRLLPAGPFKKACIRANDSGSGYVHTFLAGGSKYRKCVFRREFFQDTVEMRFEDAKFPVPACYDEILTTLYGDYMTASDDSEIQKKKHAAILDLNSSYTEHLDEQMSMIFDVQARSIR